MYPIYYSFVFLSFLYCIYKYKNNLLGIIIILSYYSGLAAYPGKFIENPYKIILLLFTVFAAIKHKPFKFDNTRNKIIFVSFVLFSITFFLSSILNKSSIILTLSQYGKFLIPFVFIFLFEFISKTNQKNYIKIALLFILLLKVQIFLSIIKFFTLGMPETTVGSIAYVGGGIATIIPLLCFLVIWSIKGGKLKKSDWYFAIISIFIAIVSIKRAIWFIMPATYLLFLFYVPKRKIPRSFLWVIPMIPIIFYVGARLNPTLNKEGKVWGSFDYSYVINYVKEYNFGKKNENSHFEKKGEGRGGATILLLEKFAKPNSWSQQDLFGYGLEEFVNSDYETFDENKFGINSRGAVTGVFSTYISFGFIGTIFFIIYISTLISSIKIHRLKYVFIGFFIWEYFFYIGILLATPAIAITFFYIIIYIGSYYKIENMPVVNYNAKKILPI